MRKNEITVTNKKEAKGLSRVKKAVAAACGAGYMALTAMPMTVFAASGTNAITQPLDNLKTLVIAVIGAVGAMNKNAVDNNQFRKYDTAFDGDAVYRQIGYVYRGQGAYMIKKQRMKYNSLERLVQKYYRGENRQASVLAMVNGKIDNLHRIEDMLADV